MSIEVRPARPSDAERVTVLSGQLGYACLPQEYDGAGA
jgi:hypothetical protein